MTIAMRQSPIPAVGRRMASISAAATALPVSGVRQPATWLADVGWGGDVAAAPGLPRATPATAQRHATVFACCNVIAGDLAKVPLKLYRKEPDGRETRIRDHPVAYILNVEASPGVAAFVTRYALVYALCLRGNSYGYAPMDGDGMPTLLDALRPDSVHVLRSGRARVYDLEDGAGIRRRAPSRSVIHMRYMAEDGWTGRSPLQVASESMGLALAGQSAAARTAAGGRARGVIKLDDEYESEEARTRNAKRVHAAMTDPDKGGWPILGPGEDVKTLDLSAADQQLLETRKFDREQIAAMYRVPPMKLQMLEHGVKANGEQQAIDYTTDCLLHWGSLVEAQFGLGLLTEGERRAGLYLRHDFGALLRTTTKDRYEALQKATGGPFMVPNEARRIEGLDPVAEGDRLNPAPNMTRDEKARDTEEDDE